MPAPPDVADECVGLSTCGAGGQNHSPVRFCENCFARPDTHVCEAGACRAVDRSGKLVFGLQVPTSVRGAKSWTQASVNPIRADGVRVDCAALLVSTDYVDNGIYSTANSTFKRFNPAADPTLFYPSFISAEPGSDRILIVRVTEDDQGKGRVVAQGCVDGIEVVAGADTQVNLVLSTL